MRSSSGVEMLAHKFGSPSALTTLIVAGGDGVEAAAREKCTMRFVQAVGKRGVRVASVCSGTFVLAEAGSSTASAPPRIGSARGSFLRPTHK